MQAVYPLHHGCFLKGSHIVAQFHWTCKYEIIVEIAEVVPSQTAPKLTGSSGTILWNAFPLQISMKIA